MANSILTIDMITRKALEILENNLVITRNVNRQYDDSFAVEGAKIGSTLRIRLPDRALVTDGAALQVQDDNEQFTTLTVASQKHIGVNFTSTLVKTPGVTSEGSSTILLEQGSVSTTINAGDVFTISGCNAVNPQTRESTGSLFQFVALTTVAASSGTWTVTVAPMYSANHALATMDALPATGGTVTFVGLLLLSTLRT